NPDLRRCRYRHFHCRRSVLGERQSRCPVGWTLQWGFEEYACFPNSDCSEALLVAMAQSAGQRPRCEVESFGEGACFAGQGASTFGMHGHLGAYRREIQPKKRQKRIPPSPPFLMLCGNLTGQHPMQRATLRYVNWK